MKRTNVMQLGSMFIGNCKIALHISDLVWKPSTLGALLDTSPCLMSHTRGCYYSL